MVKKERNSLCNNQHKQVLHSLQSIKDKVGKIPAVDVKKRSVQRKIKSTMEIVEVKKTDKISGATVVDRAKSNVEIWAKQRKINLDEIRRVAAELRRGNSGSKHPREKVAKGGTKYANNQQQAVKPVYDKRSSQQT